MLLLQDASASMQSCYATHPDAMQQSSRASKGTKKKLFFFLCAVVDRCNDACAASQSIPYRCFAVEMRCEMLGKHRRADSIAATASLSHCCLKRRAGGFAAPVASVNGCTCIESASLIARCFSTATHLVPESIGGAWLRSLVWSARWLRLMPLCFSIASHDARCNHRALVWGHPSYHVPAPDGCRFRVSSALHRYPA